jgi:phosphoribosylaminoimidazole-succinocarboxamide synthase
MAQTSQALPVSGTPYEGKAKILASTATAGIWQVLFKDEATAFNAQKRGFIRGKGKSIVR